MAVVDFLPVGAHGLLVALGFKESVTKAVDVPAVSLIINKEALDNKLKPVEAHATWIVGLPILIGLLCSLKNYVVASRAAAAIVPL
jgi:hypothetical protein